MTQADRIRAFVVNQIIEPARNNGDAEITVRAGDIHKELGLSNAMPAVCSALGGGKFCDYAQVSITQRRGPRAGSNVYITYNLMPTAPKPTRNSKQRKPKSATRSFRTTLDLRDSLVLISCVKQKLEYSAPARELYTSPLFIGCRTIAEGCQSDWFVLSALHGLVNPNDVIEPYDLNLNSMTKAERRDWAVRVLNVLMPTAKRFGRVVFLAGQRYREFLVGPLRERGIEIVIPMEGLTLGRQLSWLSRQAPNRNRRAQDDCSRLGDLQRFYSLLDELAEQIAGPHCLGDLGPGVEIPERGLYFFFEPGEYRMDSGVGARVVRVGTHALKEGAKSSLRGRLRQHKGSSSGGNHRGSIFRLLVGQALQARRDLAPSISWGISGSRGAAASKLSFSSESIKEMEKAVEIGVSKYMSRMPYLWLNIGDSPGPDSARAFIERNAIALLSNANKLAVDAPSTSWLGRYSDRSRVRDSGLWNNNHVDEDYDPSFLLELENLVQVTGRQK